MIAAYVGCLIGADLLGGMPLDLNLYWSLADVWQVLRPLAAFKAFDADVGLRTRRDFLVSLIFGWLLNNLVGAGLDASMLAIGGIASWNDVSGIFTGWLIGNLIVTIAITPVLLRDLTPRIQKAGLLVKQYWDEYISACWNKLHIIPDRARHVAVLTGAFSVTAFINPRTQRAIHPFL